MEMENEVYVSCHAPSLSLLLFETARTTDDQKGLLIGEICKEIISEKTDDNEVSNEQRITIYLEHCVPLKESEFFGSLGNVNRARLLRYTHQYCNKIVGWYSFRRNSRISSRTLKEILTHKSLMQCLNPARPDHFLAAFMSAGPSATLSTHVFNHVFTRLVPGRSCFESVKFKIYTMSDKIRNKNGYAVGNTFPTSKTFRTAINQPRDESSPVLSVMAISKSVSEHLKLMCKKIGESERIKSDLEKEIRNLRQNLHLDRQPEVKVREVEREPEIRYIRYDPNVVYNPGRKENPIKTARFSDEGAAPEEPERALNKREAPEPTNMCFNTVPSPKSTKVAINRNPTPRSEDNSGPAPSKTERKVHTEVEGPTRKVQCGGDGQVPHRTAAHQPRLTEKPGKKLPEGKETSTSVPPP